MLNKIKNFIWPNMTYEEYTQTIGSIDKEYIKQEIESGRDSKNIVPLLMLLGDKEYIKECIKRREELNLHRTEIASLIIYIGGKEYLKKFIENARDYGFYSEEITELIKSTEDKEYIKQCIERNREKWLYGDNIVNLIKYIDDENYTKKCIENSKKLPIYTDNIINLIKYVKDENYIKECIKRSKELKIHSSGILDLIEHIGSKKYAKECIENWKEIELDEYYKTILIQEINEDKYTKECIERRKELELSTSSLRKLIISTYDNKYAKQCIAKRDELGLSILDSLKILVKTNYSNREIKNLLDQAVKGSNKNYKARAKIPDNMTVGIEIETEGEMSDLIFEIVDIIEKDWVADTECSINFGVEVKSPILNGNKSITKSIRKVCTILQCLGGSVSHKCGGHIHIGAKYLKSEQSLRNLTEIWSNTEKIQYIISNREKEIPRRAIIEHAVPLSKDIQKAIEVGAEGTHDSVKEFVQYVQNDKYYSINFLNIGKRKLNTIEFRTPNGTLDPDIWIENINLFAGIMKASEELTSIQNKKQLSDKEQKMLKNFEIIKNSDSQEEKLEALLKLAIPKEDRQIYRQRYYSNIALTHEDENISGIIDRNIATKPISINKMGKEIFTGEDAITGVDFAQVNREIQINLQRQKDAFNR